MSAQVAALRIDEAAPADELQLDAHLTTDEANAKRAAEKFSHMLACSSNGWKAWDGRRWHVDDDAALGIFSGLGQVILQEAAKIAQEAAAVPDQKQRKMLTDTAAALVKHSMQTENIGKIRAAMDLARPKLKKPVEVFDSNPFLFNCHNGTIDLRTGRLLAHDREHYITKLAGCAYNPLGQCPKFLEFLEGVFQKNDEMVSFINRLVGYMLTGSTREHALLIAHGLGRNGKTTLLRTIIYILGEYARPAPAGFFELRRDSREDQNTALLFGLRLVVGHETERGAMLRESFVKLATGDDRLSGRRLYQEPFDFSPTHKLILATNHRPRVSGTDEGIWRRLMLIPFNARFTAEAGNLDPLMREKLEAEAEGILAWAVRGCIAWQRDGLNPPVEVRAATEQYRREEDVVAQFIDECCILDSSSEEASGDVYRCYSQWAEAAGLRPLGQKGFTEQLKTLGVQPQKGGGGRRMLVNIKLLAR